MLENDINLKKDELMEQAKGGQYSNDKKMRVVRATRLLLENTRIEIPILLKDM